MTAPAGVPADRDTNAVGRMLGVLGDEWTLLIVQQALLGATRYGQFGARLPISHAVLSKRLATMTTDGLLDKRTYQAKPARAEYVLTPRGRALWPMLTVVWAWERRWVAGQDAALPVMRHRGCGAEFTPVVCCSACREAVTERELAVRWGPSGGWARSIPAQSTRRRSSADRREREAGLFPETTSILGNRWGFALLVAAFVGATRFGEFQEQLGAPPGTLADRLQIFTANEVLTDGVGGYRLTAKGRAVLPVLLLALQWAQHWYPADEGPAVVLRHTSCGATFTAALTCDQCAEVLVASDVQAVDPR